MKQAFMSMGVIAAFVLTCVLADLTGTWKGSVNVQGNALDLTYKLKADGDKLAGTVTSSYGELPLIDGKVNGTDFSYKLDINGEPREATGKYLGDSIVITSKFGDTEYKNTFKRVAE